MKTWSLKRRINITAAVMFLLVSTMMIASNMINYHTMKQYDKALSAYRQLNSYYNHIDAATSDIKDYLYTEQNKALQKYKEEMQRATTYIHGLQDDFVSDESWRFDLLENMTRFYDEECQNTIHEYQNDKGNYTAVYNALLHSHDLIARTSDRFYNVITNEMTLQKTQMDANQHVTFVGTIILLLIVLCWLFYFGFFMSVSFIKPLYVILQNINKVKKGEYDLSDISSTGKEMESLCIALNEMAISVQNEIASTKEKAELQHRLLETENENLCKDEQLAQSELRMLQNQINPHFLFNTLNMIYKLALSENADNAAEMIERTSRLLRYGLDKQNRLSDLQSELVSVANYMEIQQKRLGERVQFKLEVQEGIPNIAIPGMILQPLVENALKHGLKDCKNGGEILVSASYTDEDILLSVSDNGTGMNPVELEELILNDYKKYDGENHFGLYNVVRRVEMVCGNNASISINSDEDCGFELIIQIHIKDEEEAYVSDIDSGR